MEDNGTELFIFDNSKEFLERFNQSNEENITKELYDRVEMKNVKLSKNEQERSITVLSSRT